VLLPSAGAKPDYLGGVTPNWAFSPPLRKFVDTLPGLGSANANNLGQYLSVAVPDTITYPGSDYYEIELRRYTEKMHSDLPPTTLQGYVQVNNGTDSAGNNTVAPAPIHYLGPLLVAQKDRPVRIKFTNKLPTGAGGDLFIPVDTTNMGAGMGPYMAMPMMADRVGGAGATVTIRTMAPHNLKAGERIMLTGFAPAAYNGMFSVLATGLDATHFQVTLKTDPGGPATTLGHIEEMYTQNRATLHLHGGRTCWISDGTPHQWTTPVGEITQYPRGVTVSNVPDMPDPGAGSLTFFYSNQQSARLMFYHDHAWGITRLNVYAGEAAGHLVVDQVEKDLIAGTNNSGVNPNLLKLLPDVGIPLLIQDRTFVDAGTLPTTDPTWNGGTQPGIAVTGNLWFPHVYMPNQNPNDLEGINAMGRWDYGPWFWPPWPVTNAPITLPDGTVQPNLPDVSMTMEAYMDTPLVNGTAYPTVTLQPMTYRFRILNAANDRMLNLQLYQASPIVGGITRTNGGSGYTSVPVVTIAPATGDATGKGATAQATVDLTAGSPTQGQVTTITLMTVGSGYTAPPTVSIAPPTTGAAITATATATLHTALTEVGMVPAVAGTDSFPPAWTVQTPGQPGDILDGRSGGVPDPAKIGPPIIQIGTEGGFLPAPVVHTSIPQGFDRDPKSITVGNVKEHNLLLGPAERADVLIDFSAFAGRTVILYNDAPAAVPAPDARLDYYTNNLDLTVIGGHAPTLPGYGPNTRTILRITVAAATPAPVYNLAALQAVFASTATTAGVFAKSQDPILVPQAGYNTAYNATFPAGTTAYERIQSNSLTFHALDLTQANKLSSTPLTITNKPKCIQELFENTYGRMNALLGVEIPFTNGQNQTTIPYGFIDPPVTFLNDSVTAQSPAAGDGTQIWKITHNGVDTHPIHFHLFDVQLLNRVDWAGVVKLPELNELGWKETVRMNPLEDCIVALRPVAPKPPFGVLDSRRPLNPMMPIGDATGFTNIDTNGNPIVPPVTNVVTNFGWEYMRHCHILSHEEMDMMRPVVFHVARSLAAAPVLTAAWVGTRANLTWTDATPPTPVYPLAAIATVGANVTSFTDTTVAAVTTYRYQIVATNSAGSSAPSNVVTVTTPQPVPPPTAPTSLVATLQAGPSASLTWRDNATTETGFVVERANGNGVFATIATVGARIGMGNVTYTDSTVTPGGTYTYRVKAMRGTSSSAYSNTATVSVPTFPEAPSGLTATGARALLLDTVTLHWTDNATNETSFTIQRSTNTTFTARVVTVNNVAPNSTSYVQTLVPRRTTYYYRIQAVNSGGVSAWSNVASVTAP
jgi:FtsP/CotA-like multicopper oxidase with cupredoxin domain